MPTIQEYMAQLAAARAAQPPAQPNSAPGMVFYGATPAPSNKSDLGLSLKAGVQQLPGIATGLADLPIALAGGGRPISNLADWMGEKTGFQPSKWAEATSAQHTPEYQKNQQDINQVWQDPNTGALDVAKAYATHPGYVANQVVESLPSMVAGGFLSKGLMAAGRGLIPAAEGAAARVTPGILERKTGEWAAPIAGGIGEGAVQAGQQMNQYQGDDQQRNAVAALGSGALDALIAGAGGRLANKLGFETPETYMAKVGDKAVERVVETGKDAPSKISRMVGGMISEGVLQEFPQSFQEQMWQNFADKKPLTQDALRQAVEGGLAGAFLGAGANALPSKIRSTPPGQVTDDQLKGVVDGTLTPPTAPLQAEHDQMQREFAAANAPQGTQYPGIARMSDKDLQDLAARLGSEQGKNTANSAEILDAVAQELQARAPKPETPLSRADQDIADAMAGHERATAVDMGLDLFGNPSTPTAIAQPVPVQEGIAPATDLSATPQMFDAQGNVQPEIAFNERAARAQPRTSQEEVAARLQAARAPAPNGQAALMAGQLPAAGPIALAQAGTPVRIPESTLKGLPPAAKTELSKHLGDGQIMAAAVADMYYTKMSEDTNRRPVGAWVGKLPALYQQLTGQEMPETPEQAQQITQTAIGAQGADFLQGETPSQAAENYTKQQDLEALNRPLPDVTVPKGQASFLTPQGEVDTIQKGLSRRESAKQTQARAYAAKQKAARQQAAKAAGLEPANTNIEIPEAPNAVQKSGSEGVAVQQPAQARQKVPAGNTQGDAATEKGQAEGEVNVPATIVATPSSKGKGNLKATSTRAGGTEQGSTGRGVSGSAGTPEASNSGPVVMGAGATEQPAGVASKNDQTPKGYTFAKMKAAYFSATSGPKGKAARMAELTGIAELEITTEKSTKADREQADKVREFLDSADVTKQEAALARRQAQDDFNRVERQQDILDRRDAAKVARAATLKKQLDEVGEEETQTQLTDLTKRQAKALRRREANPNRGEERGLPKEAVEAYDAVFTHPSTGEPLYSIGTADKNGGMDVKSVMGVLQSMFNSPTRLNDLVNVVASEAELSLKHLKALNTVENGKVGAFFNPETGKVWIIAGNMAHEREVFAVMLHEVGVHMGMRNLLGKNNYDKLISQLDVWEKAGTGVEGALAKQATERAAQAEAAAKQKPDVTRFNEERLAYFVEEAVLRGIDPTAIATQPKTMQAWWRRLHAALKSALRKLGMKPESLTAQNIVDLAYGAARMELNAAWHGTAAEFRKFNHKFMGTGEGAQAYGWGTYLAQKVGIAKEYWQQDIRRKTKNDGLYVNGVEVVDPSQLYRLLKQNGASDYGAKMIASFMRRGASVPAQMTDMVWSGRNGESTAQQDQVVDALDMLEEAPAPAGSLMRVDTALQDDEFLDLDKLLSEQSQVVKDALKTATMKVYSGLGSATKEKTIKFPDDWTGKQIYRFFEDRLGSQKAASEYLDSIGIKGNKFLDYTSRNLANIEAIKAQVQGSKRILQERKDAGESAASITVAQSMLQRAEEKLAEAQRGPTRNLVIFNDKNIQRMFTEVGASKESIKYSIKNVTSPTTIKALTDYKAATAAAATLMEKVTKTKPGDMKLSVFKNAIPWFTKHHLVSQFDKLLGGGLSMNAKADSIQESTTTRFNQMFNEPYHQFEALTRSDPERAKAIGDLMRATEMKIDPRKSWDDQKHLHSLTGTQLAQTRQYANEYKQKWGKMPAADQKLYSDLATMNETMYTAELAVTLYNIVRANPGAQNLKEFQADPSEKFRQSGTTHGAIQPAQDYWRGVLDTYTAALEKYVAEQRGLLPQKQAATPEQIARDKAILREIKSDKNKELVRRALRTRENTHLTPEQQKMVRHLTPLEAQLKMANDTTATFEQAPYFHLGRFGDQFVSFRVRTTNDGEYADPAAMEHVQKVLAEKFDDVTIRTDAMDPHVFARFESVDTAQSFVDTLRELQKQGWLMQKGVKDKNNKDLGAIVSQSRADIIPGYHTAGPNWLTRVVESIQGEDYDDATKAHMVAHVRSLYLDSLPDTAAIKVKQKREGRPGWHADMLRSYAHRMRVGSNRIGSLAAEPTRTQSFSVMKDAKSRSETDPNMSQSEKSKLTQVIDEFERRNSEQMAVPHTPAIDVLRATNHAFFLGMSPSYLLLQMTQLGVLTWPELAKRYGFVNAGKTLAKVTPLAFKVITHTISEGYKARGLKGAADMVVTGEMLENAGLSQEDANFLVKVMAAGKIDIGNAAREIGRVSEGDKGSEALKIASALGYASETVTRIATALAAKRMHDQAKTKTEDVVDYAIKVIDESMLNYTSTNVARMTGKHGLVGTMTPVMFSFMQYQFQLLEKLYREIYTAYSKGSTKDQQAEARTFLAGHMMSMMALAGSLGLPFASVIAAAADKMCGLFGEGYCDSTTAMRNMTAAVFGHDIEPILSKGIPRAMGFDISARAGEGDVLPFSKFLTDKRKMEDALKDLAWSSWGAPSSMIASMYKGYERVADGDLLGGMQEGFPLALKGPVKAYEMSTKGYTDKAGNVLPMTPGAWDIMVQTLGLQPGEKADYQQAKFAQSQRKGVMGREATMIRNKLATSIEQGDDSGMRDWMKKAREFDSQNPGQAGILTQMGSTLQQRARLRAQAAGTGTPLGVSPKDYEAQKFTSFYR